MPRDGRKKLIEELYKKPFREIMRECYIENQMTYHEMAKKFHVSTGTIHNWLTEAGIGARVMHWV
jgi:uncharacterized protein YjcR